MLLLQQDLCTDTDKVTPFKKWLSQGEGTPSMETGLCRLLPSWKNQSSVSPPGLLFILSAGSGRLLVAFQNTALWPGEWNKERRNTTERNVWCVYKGMTPTSQRCFSHSCACLISCPDGHVAAAWTKQPRSTLVNGLGLYAPLDPFSLKG